MALKVIFLGTPQFGVPTLQKIFEKHRLLACVCQPDKAGSRGKVEFSPVKKFALQHNVPLYQFEKISRDGVETLKSLAPDVMVTAAYGQILSQEVIDIPRYGIINVHGSLLPELRGAAPIQYAVLKGMKRTGITILKTVLKVDAGDILLQKPLDVLPYENCGSLFERMAQLGAQCIEEALEKIESGKATYTPQDETKVTFSAKITAEQERIDWSKPSQEIINLILALSPQTGAYTRMGETTLKIFDARLSDKQYDGRCGQVVECGKKVLAVLCGDGKAINVLQLQLQNAKKMDVVSFLCGRRLETGSCFE